MQSSFSFLSSALLWFTTIFSPPLPVDVAVVPTNEDTESVDVLPEPEVISRKEISLRSDFLLLGKESGPVVTVRIFEDREPLIVDDIVFRLSNNTSSINSLAVYSGERSLGRASRSGQNSQEFILSLTGDTLNIPRREEAWLYATAIASRYKQGGISGELIEFSSVTVRGHGAWSSDPYSKSSLGTSLPFQTARATVTDVLNAGPETTPLFLGPAQTIATFRVTADHTDTLATTHLTDIDFFVSKHSSLFLSTVGIQSAMGGDIHSCSYTDNTIRCNDIPVGITGIPNEKRTFRLVGDIALTDSVRAWLQVGIARTGSPLQSGDVRWTDGETVFEWIAPENSTIEGTYWHL